MRVRICFALLTAVAMSTACGRSEIDREATMSEASESAARDAVRAVADSVFAAANRLDVAIYSFYAPNTTALASGSQLDWADYVARAPAVMASRRSARYEPLEHQIDIVAPTVAVWHGRYRFEYVDTAGAATSGTGAQTWLFSRGPEGWRIIHVHVSQAPSPAP